MPKYLIDTDAGTCVPFSAGVLLYDKYIVAWGELINRR